MLDKGHRSFQFQVKVEERTEPDGSHREEEKAAGLSCCPVLALNHHYLKKGGFGSFGKAYPLL